jgi:hypothetical protein
MSCYGYFQLAKFSWLRSTLEYNFNGRFYQVQNWQSDLRNPWSRPRDDLCQDQHVFFVDAICTAQGLQNGLVGSNK